jgi:hypothetical protein
MTLLVRNEADIVRDTMRFHLHAGVDHIVVTDNASTDGTIEIVEEFVRMGVANLIHEPRHDHSQAEWVTRMAVLARDRYAADWIINADADEFWCPAGGNLKDAVRCCAGNVLRLYRRNMLPILPPREETDRSEHFPPPRALVSPVAEMTTAVISWSGEPAISDMDRYMLWRLGPKVMCRAAHLRSVASGNHDVELGTEKIVEELPGAVIYHYPIRSFPQFEMKVAQGGAALESNTGLSKDIGFHWRAWFDIFRSGDLKSAYERTILSPETRLALLEAGQLREDVTIANIVTALHGRHEVPGLGVANGDASVECAV